MWTFRISKYIYSWFCITKEDKLRLPLQAKYNSRVPVQGGRHIELQKFSLCAWTRVVQKLSLSKASLALQNQEKMILHKSVLIFHIHWSFWDIWMKIGCIRNWFCLPTKSKIRYLTILKIDVTIVYEINLAQNLYNAYNYTSLSHAIVFPHYHVHMVLPQRAQDRTKAMISESPNKKIF